MVDQHEVAAAEADQRGDRPHPHDDPRGPRPRSIVSLHRLAGEPVDAAEGLGDSAAGVAGETHIRSPRTPDRSSEPPLTGACCSGEPRQTGGPALWRKAYQDGVTGLASMVAYNLLLSLFALALVALFVTGRLLKSGDLEVSVLADLQRIFPSAAESR